MKRFVWFPVSLRACCASAVLSLALAAPVPPGRPQPPAPRPTSRSGSPTVPSGLPRSGRRDHLHRRRLHLRRPQHGRRRRSRPDKRRPQHVVPVCGRQRACGGPRRRRRLLHRRRLHQGGRPHPQPHRPHPGRRLRGSILQPQREQPGPHPRRLGLDRLRRRDLHLDRRPDPQQHRRPERGSGLATAWDPNANRRSTPSPSRARPSTPAATSPPSAARPATSSPPWTRAPASPRPGTPTRTATPSPPWPSRARPSMPAAGSLRSAARAAAASPPWMPAAASPRPGTPTQAAALVGSPRRLGLDRLRRRLLHLDRRPDPQLHRRPECEQRPRHCLEPQRERHRLRPRRLGLDRLRRRELHLDRRPDPQRHRRPGCEQRRSPPPGTPTRQRAARHRQRPRRLGLDRLRRRGLHLDRRPDPQPHRRPGRQRRRHGLEPQRELGARGYRLLAVSGSTVYAGGDFDFIGGQTRNDIAALDAGSGLATAWDPEATRTPGLRPRRLGLDRLRRRGLHLDRRPDPQPHRRPRCRQRPRHNLEPRTPTATLSAWPSRARPSTPAAASPRSAARPATTSPPSTPPPASPRPGTPTPTSRSMALAVSGSTVYAGGYFTSIGGQNRSEIAALDATSGLATGWDPNAGGTSYHEVHTLAVSGSTVYVGGEFSTVGGQARDNLAALDASSGLATAWDPGVGDPAHATRSTRSPSRARPSISAAISPPSAGSTGRTWRASLRPLLPR